MKKETDSVIWMGAGQIGLAIVRRIGQEYGACTGCGRPADYYRI